jgi:hypothetical protein
MAKLIQNNWKKIDLRHELSCHFLVKAYSTLDCGRSVNKLLGYSGLKALVGDNLAEKFIINAIMSEEQIIINKLRRGLTIKFYAK